jgi:uncharacterized protein with NRDE domain
MCLVALALDQNRRFPLVIAANRDELFARPSERLAWWAPYADSAPILAGRDLESGGTWMGLTASGRLALVTNVRSSKPNDPNAPSRGQIVPEWLAAREPVDRFWMRTALGGYNGFNMLAADFQLGECYWAANSEVHPRRLERGIYGLSNASLDTAWPKTEALKARLQELLHASPSFDAMCNGLFAALADRSTAPDVALPDTGIPLDLERQLSAAFVRLPEGAYGTRCSTLIVTERARRHLVTHVLERTFSATGGLALLRRTTLRNWPPRYAVEAGDGVAAQGAVTESSVADDAQIHFPPKRTRVRSLLKPDAGRHTRAHLRAA